MVERSIQPPPSPKGKSQDAPGEGKRPLADYAVRFFGSAFTLFILLSVSVWVVPPERHREIFLLFTIILTILVYPGARKKGERGKLAWSVDILLMGAGSAGCVYLLVNFWGLVERVGDPTKWDLAVAFLLVVIVVEATRRTVGWAMVIIPGIFILYAFMGPYIPGFLGHAGVPLERLGTNLALTTSGIFGVPVSVVLWYVLPFVLFGAFLKRAGVVEFFSSIAFSLVGKSVGGPAKVAVFSSALMGSLSGSAVANVAATGVFTIPTMKKAGFRPASFVGAVEAAASTGGQFMPPIMGATAFVMAEFLGVPYLSIVKAALVPAILYFAAIGMAVHFKARLLNLGEMEFEREPIGRVIKTKGYMILPFVVVVVILLLGFSPTYAGLWGIASTVVISLKRRIYLLLPVVLMAGLEALGLPTKTSLLWVLLSVIGLSILDPNPKQGLKAFMDTLEEAARTSLSICAIGACAGIIIEVTLISGLGLKISNLILNLSGGHLIVILVLTALTSIVFGMGLPSVVTYILLVTLIGPALIDAGVLPMMGHLFIFYFGMYAMVTPPVAYAAYTAAAIAGADPMQTAVQSFLLASPAILLPFAFVYGPALALIGTPPQIAVAVITALLGIVSLAGGVIGFFYGRPLGIWERAVLALAAILLVSVGQVSNLIGLLLLAALALTNKKSRDATLGIIRRWGTIL